MSATSDTCLHMKKVITEHDISREYELHSSHLDNNKYTSCFHQRYKNIALMNQVSSMGCMQHEK